jgi:hypothetical protein
MTVTINYIIIDIPYVDGTLHSTLNRLVYMALLRYLYTNVDLELNTSMFQWYTMCMRLTFFFHR